MTDTITVDLERSTERCLDGDVLAGQIVEPHRKGGRTFIDLAKEFNLSATTGSNWVRAAEKREPKAARANAAGGEGGESDQVKIKRLEKELARKVEELEILGKALAFFARRTGQ